jgi:hypothetical protein
LLTFQGRAQGYFFIFVPLSFLWELNVAFVLWCWSLQVAKTLIFDDKVQDIVCCYIVKLWNRNYWKCSSDGACFSFNFDNIENYFWNITLQLTSRQSNRCKRWIAEKNWWASWHLVHSVVDFSRKGSRLFLYLCDSELYLSIQCGFCVVVLVTARSQDSCIWWQSAAYSLWLCCQTVKQKLQSI